MMKLKLFCPYWILSLFALFVFSAHAEEYPKCRLGAPWLAEDSVHINAHGGNVILHEGVYYWFGEHRTPRSFSTQVGVNCYTSTDLFHWKHTSVALPVSEDETSDIVRGCIIERPKVVYNRQTGKFVMWFHLELKGRGYEAARCGVAISDTPEGPYTFLRSFRPNAGVWPMNMTEEEIVEAQKLNVADYSEWWTPTWYEALEKGLFVWRDWKGGQMSRDMTVFVDEDGKAYHIYSSEDNLTLHIAELSDDYLNHTGKYIRLAPGGHNEAPTIFKRDGVYWLITSGCTGWEPNEARMFSARNIFGPWEKHANPCVGPMSEKTFGGQGTYIFQVGEEKSDSLFFMADVWNPRHLNDSRHLWIPIRFQDGKPVIEWPKGAEPIKREFRRKRR